MFLSDKDKSTVEMGYLSGETSVISIFRLGMRCLRVKEIIQVTLNNTFTQKPQGPFQQSADVNILHN